MKGHKTRREFLRSGAKASGLLLAGAVSHAPRVYAASAGNRLLLKGGRIVDGTGAPAYIGDMLIEGATILDLSDRPIESGAPQLDCRGKVVTPGFIDAHSHMDWVMPVPDHAMALASFTAQGCTTFVGGNCGYGTSGFQPNSPFRSSLNAQLAPNLDMAWNSLSEYVAHCQGQGMSHNLAVFAGHGTTRASLRGFDSGPLSPDELRALLSLLEEAMEQGAAGVSLGLQYAPGLFAPMEELDAVARLVQSKDKVLAVHGRAYSCLSSEYPLDMGALPHNILAVEEMIGVARRTGVRLQYSHLIFAGAVTHRTWRRALESFDTARAEGVDVQFDTYPYPCGNSYLDVLMPRWFRERLPENFDDPAALKRFEEEITALTVFVGMGYADIRLAHAEHPEFAGYAGKTLAEIAGERGQRAFDTFVEMAKACHGTQTLILLEKYNNEKIVDALMAHPASLFMTDAVPAKQSWNPAAFGAFPRFLQNVRERGVLSLEAAVRKMTGATAERFGLRERGCLRKGWAADITVFDPDAVKDTTTVAAPSAAPEGIVAVFINGKIAVPGGVSAGQFLAV